MEVEAKTRVTLPPPSFLDAYWALAIKRNQIAPGYMQDMSLVIYNEVAVRGTFLMPALNESGMPGLRETRYFLTVLRSMASVTRFANIRGYL